MFDAIVRADRLQATLDSVGVLVEECKIHLDESGVEIRAVDHANVGMVDLSLDEAAFESYQADGGLIGVNLTRLADIAGMADSDQLVHLELDDDDLVDLVAGPAASLFSLDYLQDMDRAIPKDAEVTLELGEEFPMKLHFDIAEGKGAATYMLAPRIQSN